MHTHPLSVRGFFAVALLASGLSLMLPGCAEAPAPEPPPPPPVDVAQAEARDRIEFQRIPGLLRGVESADIRARVPGFLESIEFEPTSLVEPGDLLFIIEQEPYKIALQAAEAALARVTASADLEDTRLRRLRIAFERQAANELEILEQEATVAEARGEVLVARADVEQAKLNLSYTEVRSPIAGVVDESIFDVGNLVGSGENTLLTTVRRMDPIQAYFEISERVAIRGLARREGNPEAPHRIEPHPAYMGLLTGEDYPFEGVVDYAENTLDSDTGTIVLRATFDNPSAELYPGLFARVRLPMEEAKDAVVVHEAAINTDLSGKFVYVIDTENIVAKRPVTLGERQDDGTIRVLEGLDAGETYIVQGGQRARPGMPVTPSDYEPPAPETPGEQTRGSSSGSVGSTRTLASANNRASLREGGAN